MDEKIEITNLDSFLKSKIPSKELKTRIKNKQIKLNNEVIETTNIELNVDWKSPMDLGCFIFYNITILPRFIYFNNIKSFFGDEEKTNIQSLQFLSNYILISISKKEHIVLPKLIKISLD